MEFYKNFITIVALVSVVTFSSVQPSVYLRRAQAAAEQEAEYKTQDQEEYDQNQNGYNQNMDESAEEEPENVEAE